MRFRRPGRFVDLAERQLELFEEDESELLADADEAYRVWQAAPRDTAEEAYGDYQLAVDAIADRLLEIRESYAGTLDSSAEAEYFRDFGRAARGRFRRFASLLHDLEDV